MIKKIVVFVISCMMAIIATLGIRQLNINHSINYIQLSEICSKNDRVIYNKSGKFNDYIEIHNISESPIDISGYKLSDQRNLKDAFEIGNEIIEPGAYKVFFPNRFAISDYETIYLADVEGKVIDKVNIPILEEDISYAKDFEKNEWCIMQATPELANISEVEMVETVQIPKPQFSKSPGFYKEPFYLEIYAPDDAKVYYTLDGTEPTVDSNLYTKPIYIEDVSYKENIYSSSDSLATLEYYIPDYPVDKSNIIRAIAINEDGVESRTIAGDYFVGFDEKFGLNDIYVVSLITNPENLFGFEKGIYTKGKVWAMNWDVERAESDLAYVQHASANYRMEGKGWKREGLLMVYGKDRQLEYEQYVLYGIHGGWSVAHNQKGFNLYAMPEKDGKTYLCEGLLAEKETTLMLRAGGYRDAFATKIREVLNHLLVEDKAVGILRAIPCQLFIDGEYWGLYCFQERISESYIEENYGVDSEDVVILKNKEVVAGEEHDYQLYSSVVEFAKNNDLSISDNYEKIKELIDIQSYIDYFCFQIYVANSDSITNNYALWRTKTINNAEYYDGRWRWILYDTDDSAGMVEELTEPEINSFIEGYWDICPLEDTLFSALFANEEFRKQFSDTFVEMAEKNFDPSRVNKLIDKLCEEYADGTVLSNKRYVMRYYNEDLYEEEVNIIRDFYNRRQDYILKYLQDVLEKYN